MSQMDLRPLLGRPAARKSGNRFLLVCFFDPAGIATIYENIALWQRFSRHAIEVLNLWPGARGKDLVIPATIDLDDYSGIIIHCTVSYNPSNLFSLDCERNKSLEEFAGVKVLMKQDEHFRTGKFPAYIAKKRFDLVITCVPAAEREKVYPKSVVGDVQFLEAFTGYVSPAMRGLNYGTIAERPLDIVYRGSLQPLSFGRLGFEKRKIGYDVQHISPRFDLQVDISSRWVDRINGAAWFDFLGRARATLGAESGTNLFDFTGEVEAWCSEFIKARPHRDHTSEEFYNEAHQRSLHKFEGNVKYAQLSPRHFEAAASRTLQILYEGEYSGVFTPNRHFLPLRRDLANFAEIVDFLADDRRAQEMVDCAFEEIVENPANHYETFVARFDAAVDGALEAKGIRARPSAAPRVVGTRRALVLAPHEPTLDPRIEWMANGLSDEFAVCEIGVLAETTGVAVPSCERLSQRRMRVRVGRERQRRDPLLPPLQKNWSGARELAALYLIREFSAQALAGAIGALDATEEDLSRFRWFVNYFLHSNCALIEAGERVGRADVVVAADIDTLPAAAVLADQFGATLVYDAHEYWPLSWPPFRHWEVEFWCRFERELAGRADLRITVSPPLAAIMSKEYGCEFHCVPNCVPQRSVESFDLEAALRRRAARPQVKFLFLGGFGPGRGIEDLIGAWRHVNSGAELALQGPDSAFKTEMVALARGYGPLDKGITFPLPVQTHELIEAASEADVGVIPYAPSSLNNRYCSPNKLSQYMAAGLPILCNDTEFVKRTVVDHKIGLCLDFRDHRALAQAIDKLAEAPETIADMSRRSQRLFRDKFNWEAASRDIYARLNEIARSRPLHPQSDFDFFCDRGVARTGRSRLMRAMATSHSQAHSAARRRFCAAAAALRNQAVAANMRLTDPCRQACRTPAACTATLIGME